MNAQNYISLLKQSLWQISDWWIEHQTLQVSLSYSYALPLSYPIVDLLNRTHFVSSTHIIDLFNCFVVALSCSFILSTLNYIYYDTT
jgi:hypothetical protein